MTSAEQSPPAAVVLDIEGTVGSIQFVRDVLFPYARARLGDFIRAHHDRPDVGRELAAVAAETGSPAQDLEALIAHLERWSDEDRKVTPLKALQGMLWEGGYRSGALTAHLYDDAMRALLRWRAANRPVYIYSSGSVAAQKLYFGHTVAGDLTPAIAGYFDTLIGPKQAPESYRAIAQAVQQPPERLLFLSDIAGELRAAISVGLQAVQVRRDGVPSDPFEPSITSFDEPSFEA